MMQQSQSEPSFSILVLWILSALMRNFKRIFLFTLITTAITVALVLNMQKHYLSETVLYVPNEKSGTSLKDALKDVGGIGDMIGMSASGDNPGTDLMITILKSREFNLKIINEFGLTKSYDIDTTNNSWPTQVLKKTMENMSYEITDENAFSIAFKDTSAQRAQAITKRIVALLDSNYSYILKERNQESRLFYKNKLTEIENALKLAQKNLNDFQTAHNILDPEVQMANAIKSNADLEAKAMSIRIEKQVQQELKGTNSEDLGQYDIALKSTQEEIQKIANGKIQGFELGNSKAVSKVSKFTSLTREVKIQEALYKLIRQKYEEKLLDENKNIKNLVTIQEPWINHKKVSPPRASIVICQVLLCFFLALFYYIAKENLLKASKSNEKIKLALDEFLGSLPKFSKK